MARWTGGFGLAIARLADQGVALRGQTAGTEDVDVDVDRSL